MEMSQDTIESHVREKYDMTINEYRKLKMSSMRMKLLQKQLEVAMNGNVTMLIWLGKQHLEQQEKQVTTFDGDIKVEKLEDYLKRRITEKEKAKKRR